MSGLALKREMRTAVEGFVHEGRGSKQTPKLEHALESIIGKRRPPAEAPKARVP